MASLADDPVIADTQQAFATLVRRGRLSVIQQRVLEDAGVEVDRGGYVILSRIRDWAPIRLSQVAERLMVDISTVSRQVQRLENGGYLERRPDPDDRRAAMLTVTPTGEEAVERMDAAWRRAFGVVLEDWDPEERKLLSSLLERFADDFLRLTR